MYEVRQLIKTQPINGINVKNLLRNETFEVMSISLEKGAEIPEHTSPRDAFLVVLEGVIDFSIEGKSFTIEAFEDFSFPRKVPHYVSARENARILIVR